MRYTPGERRHARRHSLHLKSRAEKLAEEAAQLDAQGLEFAKRMRQQDAKMQGLDRCKKYDPEDRYPCVGYIMAECGLCYRHHNEICVPRGAPTAPAN